MSREAICNVEGDELVIRISLSALATGTEIVLTDEDGEPVAKVTDERTWAESVVDALTEEEENGETRITQMLDSAVRHASEMGYDGIEYED